MPLRLPLLVLVTVLVACAETVPEAAPSVASPRPIAPIPRGELAAAESVVVRYLSLIAERDGMTASQFTGIWSQAEPCELERIAESTPSYWLAVGRPLRVESLADTVRATLELVTVAEQVDTYEAFHSVVRARTRTDTLSIKMLPDSSGWGLCGLLSDGHQLGAFGRAENTSFEPRGTSRASLLRTVDSIRKSPPF